MIKLTPAARFASNLGRTPTFRRRILEEEKKDAKRKTGSVRVFLFFSFF